MAHISSCPSLAYLYIYQSTRYIILKSYRKRDNIFYITQYISLNIRLLSSAAWHQLAPYRQTLSISIIYSLPWTVASASAHIMDSGRGQTVPSVLDLGYSPACPASLPVVYPAHQCACPTTFASIYRSVLDGLRTTSPDK